MAVKEESLHHATEDLILPSPRKYYRALIQNNHWQLRSLISAPKQNIIYFPSGSDIIALNTKNRERETVATITFSPRCLAASKEWICCGGEDGNYTTIYLTDGIPDLSRDADSDARLRLDLDSTRGTVPAERAANLRPNRVYGKLPSNSSKVGSEIVNCVTLWSPNKDTSDRAYQIPVVVVSNNDHTVSILNVDTLEVLQKLTLPDCVNRSLMSPDGELLVSMCDDPFLYVHKRNKISELNRERFDLRPENYEWVMSGRIQLKGQYSRDESDMRGSFAAAFNSSGKYLAVATQYGMISIFDAQNLTVPGSLVAAFTCSRPGTLDGAVRAMEFSPGPVDLLAWTESSGRVVVADVRTLFLSRQVVLVDAYGDGVESVNTTNRIGEPIVDPRLRSFRTEHPSNTTTDYLGLDRQFRELTRGLIDRHQAPLTTSTGELEVLQAHSAARRERDAAAASREALAAVATSRWGPWANGQRSAAIPVSATTNAIDESAGNEERRISTGGLPAALREFVNPDRTGASFRSFINERNRESERRIQLQQEPSRNSGNLPTYEHVIERESLNPRAARNANETSNGLQRLTLTPPRLANETSSSAWAEIDALYRTQFPPQGPRLRVEVEDEDRRDFAHRLRQPYWRPLDELSQAARGSRDENASLSRAFRPGQPADTVGCCWSEDGRILYAGAQDGIYEYHVNLAGRKMFPSLVMR